MKMKLILSNKSSLALLLLIGFGMFGTTASADEGQFYIAPGIQWMKFRGSLDLHNDEGFALGLGYDITDRLSIELDYFELDPDVSGGGSADLDQLRLDLLYDLDYQIGDFRTFAVTGLGENDFSFHDETVWDLGVGVKYQLAENIEWRTALRSFFSLDRESTDIGIDTSLIFRFGGRRSPAPAPAPIVEEAPVVEEAPARVTIVDSDNDGVPDGQDACPDTPRTYAVDNRGCPIPVEEIARVELEVNFEVDRSEVQAQYFDEIQEVTDFMNQYPEVIVELEGHTDSDGAAEYNQDLSQRRADAVRQVMIDRFNIQGSRISATGYGESRPIASNGTAAGKAQNRRVVTVIIQTLQNFRPR